MSLFTNLAWRRMSVAEREEIVEGLLNLKIAKLDERQRTEIQRLHPDGQPLPTLAELPGVVPTDIPERASAIVTTAGKNANAVAEMVEAFRSEVIANYVALSEKAEAALRPEESPSE